MPTSSPIVRRVRESDVPAAVVLVREVLAEFGLRFGEGSATDAELLGLPGSYDQGGGAFWVAEGDGGALLGTCGVFPVGPGTYELRKMYLAPASRGLGLGQKLLDTSVAWVRAQGGLRMVLDTITEMKRAIAFYEANGFVRDDREIRGARCSRGYARDLSGDLGAARWLFHVAHAADWASAGGALAYGASFVAREGFVHASYRDAVAESARLHFPPDADLVVLQIDPRRLDVPVEVASTPRGAMPHIHGLVPIDAIRAVLRLSDLASAPDRVA